MISTVVSASRIANTNKLQKIENEEKKYDNYCFALVHRLTGMRTRVQFTCTILSLQNEALCN